MEYTMLFIGVRLVAKVVVETEREEPSGWRFSVSVLAVDRNASEARAPAVSRHTVHLSWADYDLWCQGRSRPEAVVKAVVEFVVNERLIEPLPERFDAAMVRRWRRGADDELRRRV